LDQHQAGAVDLRLRWQEQHYIFRHKNPFEVRDQWDAAQKSRTADFKEDRAIEPDLGIPRPGYPPWAYGTGTVLMWPSQWTAARYYFAAVDFVLLLLIALLAYHQGQPGGKQTGLLFCVAVLAAFSIHSTLGTGQLGIVVLASLFGAWWFDEHDRPILAGLCLGIALIKPTLSFPFLIPMLVKRRWLALVTAALYVGLSSCFTWWLSGTDPVAMLQQMFGPYSLRSIEDGVDPIAFLSRLDIDARTAMRITGAGVLAISLALSFIWRRESMLTLFGIAAMTARLWTYHRGYDDVIGVFLMLGLGALALERHSETGKAAFLVMGLTLWLPARILGFAVELLLLISWIACSTVLLGMTARKDPNADFSAQPPAASPRPASMIPG
jgi:hypothetical protein